MYNIVAVENVVGEEVRHLDYLEPFRQPMGDDVYLSTLSRLELETAIQQYCEHIAEVMRNNWRRKKLIESLLTGPKKEKLPLQEDLEDIQKEADDSNFWSKIDDKH